MLNSKEHYELMEQFERQCRPGRLDKESKDLWQRGIVYQDGHVNEAFIGFRKGYAYGQFIAAQDAPLPVVAQEAAAVPAVGQWQDIATAPKDGRIVLYWVASVRFEEDEETGLQREVDVSAADFGCWMPDTEHPGYHDPFGGIPGDQGGVTHWMPLPAPPGAALAGGDGGKG